MFYILIFVFVLKQCNTYLILPNRSFEIEINSSLPIKPVNDGKRPDYFDWREKDKVSPVKHQQGCKAYWAFAVVANIESQVAIQKNIKVILSEQFLIDCDEDQNGCENGSLLKSFANIVLKFGGVLHNQDYCPYEGSRNVCRWHSPPPKLEPVVGFRRIAPNEKIMAEYIWKYGPITAGINSKSMTLYRSGTIDEPTDEHCNPEERDHAVLIVGYNYHKSANGKETPYWIIKNSWGKDWGDDGFYYLVRGRNACGIASDVSTSIVTATA